MARISKYIEYRRALWMVPGQNLEHLVRKACKKLNSTHHRIVKKADKSSTMGISAPDYKENGFGLHCVNYVDKQGVGIIPMGDKENAQLAEKKPENDENFLNSNFWLLVSGDHVLSVNAGMNCASARQYLYGLFDLAGLNENATKFDIVRVSKFEAIRKIEAAGGVASIQMDLSIQEASAKFIEDEDEHLGGWKSLVKPLSTFVQDLVTQEKKASTINRSQKGMMRLSVRVPEGDLAPAKEGLNGLAEIILDDQKASDYSILLRNGEKILPHELAVKKQVRLEREANSVRSDDVFQEMVTFFEELRKSGQLEA